jgi:hypothetical protein
MWAFRHNGFTAFVRNTSGTIIEHFIVGENNLNTTAYKKSLWLKSWLRNYAANQKDADSIPDEVDCSIDLTLSATLRPWGPTQLL